jgi:hypothetical protein
VTGFSDVEYCVLHYVPNTVIRDERVSVAAIFTNSSEPGNKICTMICAANWQTKVRGLDPDADLAMLDALLKEIGERLQSPSERSDMIRQIEESFSNAVWVSQRRKCSVPRFLRPSRLSLSSSWTRRPRRCRQPCPDCGPPDAICALERICSR